MGNGIRDNMPAKTPISDPTLLAQLESPELISAPTPVSTAQSISDPALLAQLESPEVKPVPQQQQIITGAEQQKIKEFVGEVGQKPVPKEEALFSWTAPKPSQTKTGTEIKPGYEYQWAAPNVLPESIPESEQVALRRQIKEKQGQIKSTEESFVEAKKNFENIAEQRQTVIKYQQQFGQSVPLLPELDRQYEESRKVANDKLVEIGAMSEEMNKLLPKVETSYIGGALKAFNNGVADILDALDAVIPDIGMVQYGEKEVGAGAQHRLSNLAKSIRENDEKTLLDMPDNVAGDVLGGLAGMAPDLLATAFAPEIKLLRLAKATEGVVTQVPKFGTYLGTKDFLKEYGQSGDVVEAAKSGLVGLAEGSYMHALGYSANKVGDLAKRLGAGEVVSKATGALATGLLFGSDAAIREYLETGEITQRTVASAVGTGIAFGIPGLLGSIKSRATDNFMLATPKNIQDIGSLDMSVEQLRAKEVELMEKSSSEKDINKKKAFLLASKSMQTMADIKAMTKNVADNPEEYIAEINQSTLNPQEKAYFIDHVNQTENIFNEKKIAANEIDVQIQENQKKIDTLKASGLSENILRAKTGPLEEANATLQKQMDEIYAPKKAEPPAVEKPIAEVKITEPVPAKDYTTRELTPEEKTVEQNLNKYLTENYEEAKAKYKEVLKSQKLSDNVFNSDVARELSEEYKKSPSTMSNATQIPAREFVSKMEREMEDAPVPEGKLNLVYFTAGPSGSGKTTILSGREKQISDNAHIIIDTNLSNFERAKEDIDRILSKGGKVYIQYVHREPYKAFIEGVVKRAKEEEAEKGIEGAGRTVQKDIALSIQEKSLNVIPQIADFYKDNKNVEIRYYDNSFAEGKHKKILLDDVKSITFDKEIVSKKIQDELDRQYKEGELGAKLYEGLTGKKPEGLLEGGVKKYAVQRPGGPVVGVGVTGTKGEPTGAEKPRGGERPEGTGGLVEKGELDGGTVGQRRLRPRNEQKVAQELALSKVKNKEKNLSYQAGKKYAEESGLPVPEIHTFKKVEPEVSKSITKEYEQLQDVTSPNYKEGELERKIFGEYKTKFPKIFEQYKIKDYKDLVEKSYRQLGSESNKQFEKLPVKIEFHKGEHNYESSKEMLDDVHNHNHLYVFQGLTTPHELMGDKTADKNGITDNDRFRAVHDYFGHSVEGYEFGKNGEENAWIHHSKMFSPLAQLALSTETRGQNSWVNFSGKNELTIRQMNRASKEIAKGKEIGDNEMIAAGEKLLKKWQDKFEYAQQKVAILSPEFTDVSKYAKVPKEIPKELFNKDIAEGKSVEKKVEAPPSIEKPPAEAPPASAKPELGAPGEKQLKLAQRILESEFVDEEIKQGLREKGTGYIPISLKITQADAEKYVDFFKWQDKLDEAMSNVMNMQNDMKGVVRGHISREIFKVHSEKAKTAETLAERKEFQEKAVDMAKFSANAFKEAGQEINAAKSWKALLENMPEGAVMAAEKFQNEGNEKILKPRRKDIKSAKGFLDEFLKSKEFGKIIETNVAKEIEARGEKLFGKEQKEKIVNFFDSLKIETKRKMFDATAGLPVVVWNGAMEAIKQSVLLGASVANAIKAGVDYVNKEHKGVWMQKDFELTLKEKMEKGGVKPKRNVKLSEGESKTILDVWAKRLQGLTEEKRKKLLADSVEELNKIGALSDARFEQMYAEALGLPTMTEAVKSDIYNLVNRINGAEQASKEYESVLSANAAVEKEGKGLTSEQKAAAKTKKTEWEKAIVDAHAANNELSEYFKGKKDVWATLSTILQGNLLTPLSLITNIYSNVLVQPLRFMSSGTASAMDYIMSKAAKNTILKKWIDEGRTIDFLAATRGGIRGLPGGIKTGLRETIQGVPSEDLAKRDLQQSLNPYKSAVALYEGLTGKRKMEASEAVNNFIEATFGLPADVMFRLLNLGDKPFRKAAEMGRALELAELKGLKGVEVEKFMLNPDEASAEKIARAGDVATFQQAEGFNKITLEYIQKFEKWLSSKPVIGGPSRVLFKSQVPYVKTPLNIISETIDFAVPELSAAKGISHAIKGNRREALNFFSKAIVGKMVAAGITQLIVNGMMTPPAEEGKEGQKERQQGYENIPLESINISALGRMLSGQNYQIKDKDTWISYSKMGVAGVLMGMQAKKYKGLSKEDIKNTGYMKDMFSALPHLAASGLNQSFLQGTNTFLNAIKDGGWAMDKWMLNTAGALGAIFYPNTLSAISKSHDDFIREVRGQDFSETFVNTFKNKMFMGDELPTKVTLWGEHAPNVPKGKNGYVYYLLDVTKNKQVDIGSFGYKIYDLWQTSKVDDKLKDIADDAIPSLPSNKISVYGQSFTLNPKMYEQYQMYVGKERKGLVESYVNSDEYEQASKEDKIKTLQGLYSDGQDSGKWLFIENTPEISRAVEETEAE